MSRSHMSRNMDRSYRNAIDLLNRRRRPVRPSAKFAINFSGAETMPDNAANSDLRGMPSIVGMKQWLQQLGHAADDINKLNVIHVAGTKGKGSTCAFIHAFLQCHSERCGYPQKIGLYTSPHLVFPEERIRIDMRPLERSVFAKYFFEVSDVLLNHGFDVSEPQPRYLQIYLLVAIHTFIREGVDAAIIETHHGGEYDATNVVERPVVTAITSLGMDHVSQLGPTIENIAWHKAGIFKPSATAFSVVEEPSVTNVLQNRAAEKGAELNFVHLDHSLPLDEPNLKPDAQRLNCSLALAVVRSYLYRTGSTAEQLSLHADDVIQGIRRFSWPGRFQTVIENDHQWFLDGAHNEMSVEIAGKWFIEASKTHRPRPLPRILIFGHVSEQRDPLSVMKSLVASFQPGEISNAIFTTYQASQDFEAPIDSTPTPDITETLQKFSETWLAKHPQSKVCFAADLPRALDLAREIGELNGGMQTLITGSQHLVGGALFCLQSEQDRTIRT